MPGPSTVALPKTNDAYEFEHMVADVLSKMYCTSFQPFGRRGQKQYGIDAISTDNTEIVAQCKNFDLTEKVINDILDDFTLEQDIKQLIIATSMNSDTKIQLYISRINSAKKYTFSITVMFWDSIVAFLYQYQDLYTKYYGNFAKQESKIEYLRETFNEGIKKHQIICFLRRDIFVEGIPIGLPSEVEEFTTKLLYLLSEEVILQNENIYKSIMSFCYIINDLNGFLGCNLFPSRDSRRYIYIPDMGIDDSSKRKKINDNISSSIKALNLHYGIINHGMTMFP